MSAFLEFLNSADLESLKSLPGMNQALAERLIAARPLASIEDSLPVRGMNRKLLERLQTAFAEKALPAAEAPQLPEPAQPAEEPPAALPARLEPASQPRPTASEPGFWSRLQLAFLAFLRFLLTLFFIFLILAGIGAGLYYGLPYLEERYVVPVEQNTNNLSALATAQMGNVLSMSTQVSNLNRQIADLQKQIDTASLRADSIEQTIADHAETLTRLEQVQSQLDEAAAKQRDIILVELKHQVMLTRAIETLSRGRLYLSQSNFGMAREDVQSARNLLAELKTDLPDYQAKTLETVLTRLDLALGNLPEFPVIAVDDVEIAWNLLIAGLPESAAEAATLASTPTPPPTLEATPTPEEATLTPTITPTP